MPCPPQRVQMSTPQRTRSSTTCIHDLRARVGGFARNRTTNLSEHLVGAMRVQFSQRIEIFAELTLVTGVGVGVGNPLPRPGGILSLRQTFVKPSLGCVEVA